MKRNIFVNKTISTGNKAWMAGAILKRLIMKTKIQIYLLVAISILLSCRKENTITEKNNSKILLFRQMNNDSILLREFSYTSDSFIIESKEKWIYFKFKYDNGKLISYNFYHDPSMFSSSNPDKRTEWVDSLNTELTYKRIYEYDDFGRINKSIDYDDDSVSSKFIIYNYYHNSDLIESMNFYMDDKESKRMVFEYDSKGNLIESEIFFPSPRDSMILAVVNEYQFDNKRNPYFNINKLPSPGLYTNTNNITKITTTDVELDSKSIIINKYMYNEIGYPVLLNDRIQYIYK